MDVYRGRGYSLPTLYKGRILEEKNEPGLCVWERLMKWLFPDDFTDVDCARFSAEADGAVLG